MITNIFLTAFSVTTCSVGLIASSMRLPVTQQSQTEFQPIPIQTDDPAILEVLSRAETAVREADNPRAVPGRDEFVWEFIGILQRCDQLDKYLKPPPLNRNVFPPREKPEQYRYGLDQEKVAALDPPPLRLRMRTVARIIRLLGNLEAEEAYPTLVEFLIFPWDVQLPSLMKVGGQSAQWALFQIGDAALPSLRQKIFSQDVRVRDAAARAAAMILGPRAPGELEKWVSETTNPDERNLLLNRKKIFDAYKSWQPLQDYREERLRMVNQAIERGLIDALSFPEDWEEFKKSRDKAREQLKKDGDRTEPGNEDAVRR